MKPSEEPTGTGARSDIVTRVVAPNPGPLTLDGTCSWLVGEDRLLLVDPGPASPEHLAELLRAAAGRVVDGILLTHAHADHAGGAAAVAAAFEAPVLASSSTLSRTGLAGRVLREGDDVGMVRGPATSVPGRAADRPLLRVIETPGHSADHLSYLLLPQGWLFTGDLVLGAGSSAVLHPDGRMDDYLASIRKLEALAPHRLLPGHGPPVDDAPGRLAEYRLHRLERERQIVEAIEAGADSVPAIRESVYGPLPPGLTMAAEASISAHLVRLRDAGMQVPVPGPGMFESSAPNAADDESSSGRAR